MLRQVLSPVAPRSGELLETLPRQVPVAERPKLRVWTCKGFEGYWPVGTAAVVVAVSMSEAARLLEGELGKLGLTQSVELTFEELDLGIPHAKVLLDGN